MKYELLTPEQKAELIEAITEKCFEELTSHAENDTDPIYWHHQPGREDCLTYIDWNLPPGAYTFLTKDEAKEFIKDRVRKSLEETGRVFLYTCKDNQEIDLQPITEDIQSAIDSSEDQMVLWSDIFYISFD